MIINIDNNSTHPHFILDNIYKIFVIDRMVDYNLIEYTRYNITTCDTTGSDAQYYLVIDLLYHDAFAHWVYESAIYLPLFNKLKMQYKNLKLLLKAKKTYKTLFTSYFNIVESDIVYDHEITKNNISFFPSPISSLNTNSYLDIYKPILINFIQYFKFETIAPAYDYVILPRQKKENYVNNDRSYNLDNVYKHIVRNAYKYYILNTDTLTELTEQIRLLNQSHKIILTDGSAFLVNNMLCNNKQLFVITENLTLSQRKAFNKIELIITHIANVNNNNIIYINQHDAIMNL